MPSSPATSRATARPSRASASPASLTAAIRSCAELLKARCPPVQTGVNTLVRMKQTYRGQAKQAANALWGSSAAHVRYKHVTVVDDDIDIHDYAAVDWAVAYRVNAGENDVVIMPATFGAGLDPSTRKRDRNPTLF